MISIPLTLYFFVYAVFLGSDWNPVIYAVIAGVLSKLLLRGFRDASEQIKVESYLITEWKYSPEQARLLWKYAYGDGGHKGYLRALEIYSFTEDQHAQIKLQSDFSTELDVLK